MHNMKLVFDNELFKLIEHVTIVTVYVNANTSILKKSTPSRRPT